MSTVPLVSSVFPWLWVFSQVEGNTVYIHTNIHTSTDLWPYKKATNCVLFRKWQNSKTVKVLMFVKGSKEGWMNKQRLTQDSDWRWWVYCHGLYVKITRKLEKGVPGIELRSWGLYSNHICPHTHLTGLCSYYLCGGLWFEIGSWSWLCWVAEHLKFLLHFPNARDYWSAPHAQWVKLFCILSALIETTPYTLMRTSQNVQHRNRAECNQIADANSLYTLARQL